MSCLTALESQIVTFFSFPHEILLLQHRVFREYAKIAVGPDFIHTLPSFLILTAMAVLLRKYPPSSHLVSQIMGTSSLYKILQVSASWVAMIVVLWSWLIFQRVLYCSVWTYWSYESEYRDVTYQWWQRVWASYYPPPLQPPALSAGFISWLMSMFIATTTLGCAVSTSRVGSFFEEFLIGPQDALAVVQFYTKWLLRRVREAVIGCEKGAPAEECEASCICDDCRSEMSSDANNQQARDIHPISYGTNWVPKPSFSGYKEAHRKMSMKSLHTVAGVNGGQDPDKLSPSQLRHKRGCHTVIPSNSSDKSSGC